MAPSKPQRVAPPGGDEEAPAAKRARAEALPGPQPSQPGHVVLNPSDCDLDFDIDGNGLQGHALHEQGFAYCWSGARATVGITAGKYCFGCKIISEQAVDMADTPPDQQHVCRVGISRGDDPVGNLGETANSFGFGGTGKFSNAGKFLDYGMKFGVGDTVVCAVNLEEKPLVSIGFSKNGKWLGVVGKFDTGLRGLGVVDSPIHKLPWASAIFPHVLLKNVVVQLQFSTEDGLIPEEGYKPWSSAVGDGKAIIGPSFSSPKECEVMMMVGLPASGKTTLAEKWVKDHPEKRYVLLGTNIALDQMKVPGLLRKQNYGERFERLMDRATGIFNTLLTRAARTLRNYILDQTNVYQSARNRKLKAFVNYRKIAVVIFPTPDELKFRADKRFKEMGKEVPAEAVNQMLANFVLPTSKDMPGSKEQFDEVIFPELSRVEAQKHLDEMKQAVGSPNLGSKSDHSSYPWQSSVQSFSSPSIANKDTASASSACMQTYRPTVLLQNHDNRSPLQASASYSGDYYSKLGDPGLPIPSNSPYGSHAKYEGAYPRRDEPSSYGNYSGLSPYTSRNSFERSSIPIGESSPYSGDYHSKLGDPGLPIPSNSPYGGYAKYEGAYPRRDEPSSYGNYSGLSPYTSRNSFERSSIPIGESSPYSGDYHSKLGDPGLPIPSNSPYGGYAKYEGAYPRRDEPSSYGNYSGLSPYTSRNSFERSSIPIGESSPYGMYGVRDAHRRPEFESPSSYGRTSPGYPAPQPAYNSPTAYSCDSGVHQANHQAAGGPPYEWHSPLQTSYGSSYGAPPRPPYGFHPSTNPPSGSWYL